MVERAERQHAQGHARAGEHAGSTADAAVPAADDDTVELTAEGTLARFSQGRVHLRTRHEQELGVRTGAGERGREARAQLTGAEPQHRAAIAIDDDGEPRARRRTGRTVGRRARARALGADHRHVPPPIGLNPPS